MILDTSFLIDVMNGRDGAVELSDDLTERGVPMRVPTVVLYELYLGVGAGDVPDAEREAIRSVLGGQRLVELTDAIAMRTGEINGDLLARDRSLNTVDALVAGTALVFDEPVVTDDVADFGRVENLETVSWRD